MNGTFSAIVVMEANWQAGSDVKSSMASSHPFVEFSSAFGPGQYLSGEFPVPLDESPYGSVLDFFGFCFSAIAIGLLMVCSAQDDDVINGFVSQSIVVQVMAL